MYNCTIVLYTRHTVSQTYTESDAESEINSRDSDSRIVINVLPVRINIDNRIKVINCGTICSTCVV